MHDHTSADLLSWLHDRAGGQWSAMEAHFPVPPGLRVSIFSSTRSRFFSAARPADWNLQSAALERLLCPAASSTQAFTITVGHECFREWDALVALANGCSGATAIEALAAALSATDALVPKANRINVLLL